MPRLALLAPVGAVLFTLAWLVLGAISPGYQLFDLVISPYSAISQPISGLGLGITGPYMNAAFIISGVLIAVGSLATRWPAGRPRSGRAARIAFAVAGAGLVIDGLFTLEAVMLHLLGFLLAVIGSVVGFALASYSLRPTWRAGSVGLAIAAVAALGLFVLFMVIFDPYSAGDNAGVAGLVQRALVVVVLGGIGSVPIGLRARR